MTESTGNKRIDIDNESHLIASKADNPVDVILNNIRQSYNITADAVNGNKNLSVSASMYCKDVRFLLDVIIALSKKLDI